MGLWAQITALAVALGSGVCAIACSDSDEDGEIRGTPTETNPDSGGAAAVVDAQTPNGGNAGAAPDAGSDAALRAGCATLDALLSAMTLLVDMAAEMRTQTATACAALAGMPAPSSPTDSDVENLCSAAVARVNAELLVSSLMVVHVPGRCAVNAASQFDCEASCETLYGCSCGTSGVEERCDAGELSVVCAGECGPNSVCQGSAELGVPCEGVCSGICEGQCDGACSPTGGTAPCTGLCESRCQGTCFGHCLIAADAMVDCGASARCKGECLGTSSIPECESALVVPSCCDAATSCAQTCSALGLLSAECSPSGVVVTGTGDAAFIAQFEAELPTLFDVLSRARLTTGADSILSAIESALGENPKCAQMFMSAIMAAVEAMASSDLAFTASAAVVEAATRQ